MKHAYCKVRIEYNKYNLQNFRPQRLRFMHNFSYGTNKMLTPYYIAASCGTVQILLLVHFNHPHATAAGVASSLHHKYVNTLYVSA
jgi:hypothetical protein